jgi:hypothetical protein
VRHRLARFGFILGWFAKYLQPEAIAAREEPVTAS